MTVTRVADGIVSRRLCPDRQGTASRRNGWKRHIYGAVQPVVGEFEGDAPAELVAQPSLDQAGAEASVDRRSASLVPRQVKAAALDPPADLFPTLRGRERPVLRRVGRQFVHHEPRHEHGVRRHRDGRSAEMYPLVGDAIGCKLVGEDVVEI